MRKIEAIFLDVDGTLVSFATHRVPLSAVAALQQVHQSGIKIVIATGRSAADLKELAGIPYDAVVALNGLECVLKEGTPVYRKKVSYDDFVKIESLSRQYGFPIAVETDEGIFVNKLNDVVVEFSALVNHELPMVASLEAVFQRSACCQICLYCDEAMEQQVMAQLPGLSSSRWNPLLADIQVEGVDKAAGMHALCQYYGLDASQVMAFGDGENDISMLQAAGIGVAMGQASNAVKAAADFVTDSVDDHGIQSALFQFVLGISG